MDLLRHGTDRFTSPPKEGVLRIFSSLKIRQLRPGLNQRNWALKASTLPLDHRSRYSTYINTKFLLNARIEGLCTIQYAYSGGALFLIFKLFQISFRQRHFKKVRINTLIYIKPVITLIPYTFSSKCI